MEIEIHLDAENELAPDQVEDVDKRIKQWHAEGAEIRYDKKCFGNLSVIAPGKRYQVDLGQVDPMLTIRELHALLYRHGVKVFVHFLP